MKIYINAFKYKNNNLKKKLEETCILDLQKTNIEIYSENGVYFVEKERIYKINYIDGDIETINNYCKDCTITIDRTIVKKEMKTVNCISNKYIQINKMVQRFKLRDKSPLFCIVEYNLDSEQIHDVYFQLHDKHAAYSSADLDNKFLKEDILSFISLSN